ncbi:MAG: HNH endonuclease [Rhodospirillales bacterium]|nr:HNH endonuclease [Rhodospirillales bacterium]
MANSDADDQDSLIRAAAFEQLRRLALADATLDSAIIAKGFTFDGQRWPYWNPQRGIFKPSKVPFLLSIRTVFPRKGARVWYDDQRQAHEQIYGGAEVLDYAFMGTNPEAPENQWLRDAAERQIPIIYFLGVSPGRYLPLTPTFIVDWSASLLKATIAFGDVASRQWEQRPPESDDRRYALRLVKQRLHQVSFRERVLAAYDGRCAITKLPEPRLLDAAHIVSDRDEQLGHAVVSNGIALSKIHHAAFDNHLIGISPDGVIHVSERLLEIHDGPFLELGIKQIQGTQLWRPRRAADHPDRDRLARRFEEFRAVA